MGCSPHHAGLVKTLKIGNKRAELCNVAEPDSGRIWDNELVAVVCSNGRQRHGRNTMEGLGRDGLEFAR